MFGHGSDNCNIKTFCAKCSGPHTTSNCKENTLKCANCNGVHKASDVNYPSRVSYIELRERFTKQRNQATPRMTVNNHIPQQPLTTSWNNVVRSENIQPKNDLFSIEELKNITLELISLLKNCKSKSDQFQAITTIAFKFLP